VVAAGCTEEVNRTPRARPENHSASEHPQNDNTADTKAYPAQEQMQPESEQQIRTWRTKSRQYRAAFIANDGKLVTLVTEDEKAVRVPLSELSPEDQEFIRRHEN